MMWESVGILGPHNDHEMLVFSIRGEIRRSRTSTADCGLVRTEPLGSQS